MEKQEWRKIKDKKTKKKKKKDKRNKNGRSIYNAKKKEATKLIQVINRRLESMMKKKSSKYLWKYFLKIWFVIEFY